MIQLTNRQAQILEMIRDGLGRQIISARLNMHPCTAWGHYARLRAKGLISDGKRGVAGSIKVLVGKLDDGYVIVEQLRKGTFDKAWATADAKAIAVAVQGQMQEITPRGFLETPEMLVLADALEEAGAPEALTNRLRAKAPSRKDVDEVYPKLPAPTLAYPTPPAGTTWAATEWAAAYQAYNQAMQPYYERERQRREYSGKRLRWIRRVSRVVESILAA